MRFAIVPWQRDSLRHQSNDHYRRTLPEGGPSVLEQKASQALDDICGDGVRVGRRNSEQFSDRFRHDSGKGWNMPGIFRMEKPGGPDDSQRMVYVFVRFGSDNRVCILLYSHSGRYEKTDEGDGGTQRRSFIWNGPDERFAAPVQTNQVEYH